MVTRKPKHKAKQYTGPKPECAVGDNKGTSDLEAAIARMRNSKHSAVAEAKGPRGNGGRGKNVSIFS